MYSTRPSVPALAACLWIGIAAPGAPDEPSAADPEAAAEDPDFRVQGEYAGKLRTAEEPVRWGFQVIAQGDGAFDVVAYEGGLPGAGWKGEGEVIRGSGRRDDGGGIALRADDRDRGTAVWKEGTWEVRAPTGQSLGTLERVERKSPTLGAKPPEGAIVLFDGKSVEAWERGRLTGDGLLAPRADTKEHFGSGRLHVEFRTPWEPEQGGQGRGNSGVYLQSRYEVQVLDSFGLEPDDGRCGGIYSVRPPTIHMAFPPLAWQTFDVELEQAVFDDDGELVEPARMTVRHNGVLVHERVPVPKATTAAPWDLGPGPGPLHLQQHGHPVRYRNIWFVPEEEDEG